jgi:hypothetical protein
MSRKITIGTLLKMAADAGYDLTPWRNEALGLSAEPEPVPDAKPRPAWPRPALGILKPGGGVWEPPEPLPVQLLAVPSFDPTWLPILAQSFCIDVASSLPGPLDYIAVNLFVTLGNVLGNRLLVEAKEKNSWLESPNLWGLVIGDVAQMKTPSARPFMQLMNRLQARAQHRHDLAMGQWRAAKLAHQALVQQAQKAYAAAAAGKTLTVTPSSIPPEPPEPQMRHYYSTDPTYEKLGELCANNPDGVLVFGDELSGLISLLDREDMRKARTFYLEGHNGTGSYKFDRIMRGTIFLPRFAVGVLGNIQPDPMCRLLLRSLDEDEGRNDGFMQRFFMVWPDPVALAFVDQPRPHGATQQMHALIDAFAELDPRSAGAENRGGWEWCLRLEPAAHKLFVRWLRKEYYPAREERRLPVALRAHLGKFPKLVLALSLILHLADLVQLVQGAPPNEPQGEIKKLTPISLSAVEGAIAIAHYAAMHVRRVYQAGSDPAYVTARLLARRINDGDLAGITRARLIAQHGWADLGSPERVAAGLEVLDDLGWAIGVETRRSGRRGRPTVAWHINPLGRGASP